MKRTLFIAALTGLSFLTASAQDNQKIRKDHTYSTHNYKHPNKAAVARQWDNKPAVVVRASGANLNTVANYKHPVPGAVPVGGVVVPHTPETDVALRNYKIQRLSMPKPSLKPATDEAAPAISQPTSQTVTVE